MPEAASHTLGGSIAHDSSLLREMNGSLHDLSQPMTVLLCTLEYGARLDSLAEMREAIVVSQEACERLRMGVVAMQAQVRRAMEAGAQLAAGQGEELNHKEQDPGSVLTGTAASTCV